MAEGGGGGKKGRSISELFTNIWSLGKIPTNVDLLQNVGTNSTQHFDGGRCDVPQELSKNLSGAPINSNNVKPAGLNILLADPARPQFRQKHDAEVKVNVIQRQNIAELRTRPNVIQRPNIAELHTRHKHDVDMNVAQDKGRPSVAVVNTAKVSAVFRPNDSGTNIVQGSGAVRRNNAAHGLFGIPGDLVGVPPVDIQAGNRRKGQRGQEATPGNNGSVVTREIYQTGEMQFGNDERYQIHPNQPRNQDTQGRNTYERGRGRKERYNHEERHNRGERGPGFQRGRGRADHGQRIGGRNDDRNLHQGLSSHEVYNQGPRQNRGYQKPGEGNRNFESAQGEVRNQGKRGRGFQRGRADHEQRIGGRNDDRYLDQGLPSHEVYNQGPRQNRGYQKPSGDGNQNFESAQGEVRNQGRVHVYHMHYKRLEELAEKDSSEVVLVVANSRNGFADLLKGDLRPDMIVLIMKVVAKVCQADFAENKASVLSTVCTSKFLDNLSLHISKLPMDKDQRRVAGLQNFFQNLVLFFETVMELLPSTACERILTVLMMTSMNLQNIATMQHMPFDKNLYSKLKELEANLMAVREDQENKQVKVTSQTEALRYQSPPDDFRELSIFPTSSDVLSRERAFVRPNIIKGAYSNVEHYLDVQFRLLREDFVWPLRDGIMDYLSQLNQQRNKKKAENIRIYQKVQFQGVKVVLDHMGLVVSFESKSKIKWEYSKRFMFGSLLCFTRDNFKNILFATVLDRDVKELELGRITVKLSEGSEITDEIFEMNFTMAESEVYFEPYYHVLKALQKMKRSDFPMSKYIVDVQSRTNPPRYLQDVPNYVWNIQGFRVPVLVDTAWPSAEQLNLDHSQLTAFKSALTKEFVVIQGPPGTGKTYLGLKIARTLLENVNKLLKTPQMQNQRRLNDYYFDDLQYSDDETEENVNNLQSPMLVVCFTNHALDQFLEGLMSTTNNIIRVGGQSKSETLKPFNLKERRRDYKRTGNILWLSRDIRNRMSTLMSSIKGIQEDMHQIDSHMGIVSISCIAEVYTHDNLNCFKDDDNKLSNHMLLEWLLHGCENLDLDPATPPAMKAADVPQYPLAGLELAMELEDEDQHRNAHMDDYELDDTQAEVKLTFILNFKKMTERLEELRHMIDQEHLNMTQRQEMLYDKTLILENEWADLDFKLRYFGFCLNNLGKGAPDIIPLLRQRVNLWGISQVQRWAVYRAWLGLLRGAMLVDLRRIETDYRNEARQFEETKQMEDLELMRKTDVVGMTTTCAARLQPLLQALKARIVIVEEAAEVMESHIIVSLTNHCQHLILIGDHQQLRPTTAVYKLAKDFNFDISLFERMLGNGLHCEVIKVQHRMRPEIASLIVPSIYKELHNHESVFKYKKIQGIVKSVFFLTHNNVEQQVGETSSRQNAFEGKMILALCRYLLLQGYPPEQITILTTYSGQMFYLRGERKQYPSLKDVQITIVDNFQGEENNIILLSLVRNNKENNIGFLKIENRVCVALSRAKHGMYIIGNMDNLTASSKVWPEIKKALDNLGAVGEALTLRCQIHRDQLTQVRSAEDFNLVPEGGCRLPCNSELLCGHNCKSLCHVQDREHKEYKCNEPCNKTPVGCVLEHVCPGRCYADCGRCEVPVVRALPCEHTNTLPCYVDYLKYKCLEKVKVTPADCGHTFDKPCHLDLSSFRCPLPCNVRLDCGHSCAFKCHVSNDPDHLDYKCKKQCTKKNAGCTQNHQCSRKCHEDCGACMMIVPKRPPHCDHLYQVACSLDPSKIECERPCKRMLPCDHKCPMQCCQECGNCQVKVKKTIAECGHQVQVKCCEEAVRSRCNGPCRQNMPCGHRCTRACKMSCSTKDTCEELVPSRVVPICGHRVQIPCRMSGPGLQADSAELLSYCREPCTSQLSCGHPCRGSCGDCLQGRIHQGCLSKCGRTLICSHGCTEPCTKACPPCKQKCRFRCMHSACYKDCGVPCTPCKEKCPWQCEHHRCTKRCGDMCDRPPCYEPCMKPLRCDHPCIGFCGEPCPPLCRVCNEEEVTNIFLGHEDEENARFVYLVDCKHTIESEGLEDWLNQDTGEITMPKCPLCKSDIMNTLRFMNRIKQIFIDVCGVKNKVYGEMDAIDRSKSELERKLNNINTGERLTWAGQELLTKLSQQLQTVHNKRKKYLSIVDTELLHLQMDIFTKLQDMYRKACRQIMGSPLQTLTQYLNLLLSAILKRDRLSEQEVNDFNMEICRFKRITELCQLEMTMISQPTNSKSQQLHASARNIAVSIRKYTQKDDDELKDYLQKLSTFLKAALTISDKEKADIVKAIGLPQGSWFKCPNGHYYAIGECGGAMEVSKCSCGESIGGTNHALLGTNRFAGDMDGATNTRWPGTAMRGNLI